MLTQLWTTRPRSIAWKQETPDYSKSIKFQTETQKERGSEHRLKQSRPISLQVKHENFIAVVRKWEILAAIELTMTRSDKESDRDMYDIFSIKRVTRKFQVVVVWNNGKEMYEKSVLYVQGFLYLLDLLIFLALFVAVAASH